MNNEALERIRKMEAMLSRQQAFMDELAPVIEKLEEQIPEYQQLSQYYGSQDYLDDLDFSESADFPADEPHGVLSEDLTYNLLGEYYQLAVQMVDMAAQILKN